MLCSREGKFSFIYLYTDLYILTFYSSSASFIRQLVWAPVRLFDWSLVDFFKASRWSQNLNNLLLSLSVRVWSASCCGHLPSQEEEDSGRTCVTAGGMAVAVLAAERS